MTNAPDLFPAEIGSPSLPQVQRNLTSHRTDSLWIAVNNTSEPEEFNGATKRCENNNADQCRNNGCGSIFEVTPGAL